MKERKEFAKYVSQNVLGTVGVSLYILADTYFIAQAVGPNGITALNLVLPVYSIIFAFGQMIGIGSAIRYGIAKSQGSEEKDLLFGNAIFFVLLASALFMLVGALSPEQLLRALGADEVIVAVGKNYTRIFMCFAPCFMLNYVCNAFVRNDGNPTTAMMATLFSSFFNILFDYILMFPLEMGMEGAALATAISPLLGVAICATHFFSKKNQVRLQFREISFSRLKQCCQVGFSAFVGEFSSAVITMAFNFMLLSLAGNMAVAAYGVIANTALVAVAVFNGVAQGSQPLISRSYGRGEKKITKSLVKMAVVTAFALSILVYVTVYGFAEKITAVFNSEGSVELARYSVPGLRIYFLGFLFGSVNMVGAVALSAMEKVKEAFVISTLRGFVLILICVLLLPQFFRMNGVWMAFPVTEFLTLGVLGAMLMKSAAQKNAVQTGVEK